MPELMFMREATFHVSWEDLARLEHHAQRIRELVTPEAKRAREFASITKLVVELCTRIRAESDEITRDLINNPGLSEGMKETLEDLHRNELRDLPDAERMHALKETDLMLLERAFPRLISPAGLALNNPNIRLLFEEIKQILSNVRWDYGPPTEVEHHSIDVEDDEDDED